MITKSSVNIAKWLLIASVACLGIAGSGDFSATLAAQAERGLQISTITDAQGQEVILYKASYALVLGVSQYTHGWPKLPGVERDVAEIKRVLEAEGFQVTTKMNLDRNGLDQAFTEFIGRYGQAPDNRVLFYFAGHGHTVATTYKEELGYLVPVDAPLPKTKEDIPAFQNKALPLKRIEEYALQIQAKHALFVFDSCFSGSLFALSRAMPEAIGYKTSQPVRQFITSGSAAEQVPDQSIFREQFVRGLHGEADGNRDGYVTGAELSEFLQTTVTNYSNNTQHPQYGKIRNPNLDKGDFVFKLIETLKLTPTPPPAAAVNADVAKLLQACERHFRAGRLLGGSGGGAFDCYQKVLAQDPANETALDGLDKIEAYYAAQAAQALAKGNQQQAQQALTNLRAVNPESPQLAELEAQLQDGGRPQPAASPTSSGIRLRNQPVTVSEQEAQQKFDLDSDWRPRSYVKNDFEARGKIVIDHATGLTWQQSGSPNDMTYQAAQEYIAALNHQKFGGYDDWRLSTVPESLSLITRERQSNGLYINLVFDKHQWYFWSIDKRSSESAWFVDFGSGNVGWYYLGSYCYVRAVRS